MATTLARQHAGELAYELACGRRCEGMAAATHAAASMLVFGGSAAAQNAGLKCRQTISERYAKCVKTRSGAVQTCNDAVVGGSAQNAHGCDFGCGDATNTFSGAAAKLRDKCEAAGLITGSALLANPHPGISAGLDDGYSNNVVNGNANPRVVDGIEIGGDVCGGDMTCPYCKLTSSGRWRKGRVTWRV